MGVTVKYESHTVDLWAIYLPALLKKVPLRTDAETLVAKHWLYFYERCILDGHSTKRTRNRYLTHVSVSDFRMV